MKTYSLDTNIVIDLFRKDNKTITKLIEIDSFYVSTIVLGELYYGAENSSNNEKHLMQLSNFSKSCFQIPITEITSKIYGKIKAELKKKGKPIPENDIWIAASSIENDFILLTNDKHFKQISNLKVEGI